ncbi:MAG: bifunctional 4-hydroxy-3-methylbut-2-enyl diphosphate reductase/30S ribosomal protein S1 [Ruminococcaceae bacterium]|nr:bifunctional 4-hydroxy-3-methylbut-2-enyl diphosphate reductase/30S ribosomal protein S1 [Oscillospiraceae bacterium]
MEIIKAETAGFCFGVAAASDKAFKLAEERVQGNIYTFGPLIHNAGVVKKLENMGVGVVEDTSDPRLEGASVIIRAHGVAPQVKKELEARGCKITDATCPFVGKIHRLVKKEYGEGKQIVIIGDPEHPEVKGINGCCDNTAYIIKETDDVKGLESWVQEGKSVSIVTQTTFNIKKFGEISHLIEKTIDKHEFFDTICSATSLRQKEAEQIASKVDLMIIVGGRNSSNTLKLYEICSQLCDNVKLVESADELEAKWFKNIRKAGVTAGASTPGWSIEEVIGVMSDIDFIENEAKNTAEENFESMLEDTLTTVTSGEIVKGAINKIDDKGVYVDLGFKYEGFIAIDEFAPVPGIETELPKVGDEVEAKVVRVSDKDCEVILSKRRIDYAKNMQVIEESFNNKTPITVKVTEAIKGGVIAFAGSVRIFIPASQIALRFVKDLSTFVGQEMEIIITSFEKGIKGRMKIVGSRKVIVEAEYNEKEEAFWGDMYEGKVCKGIVKSFTTFGAFVDIGGYDGLIHLTELAWRKVKHPSEILTIGQEVEVNVISFDREKKKISLGYRKAEDNPWKDAENLYQVGDIFEVTVVRFVNFGVFVNIAEGVDGLVHISQISNKRIKAASDCLELGQKVQAKVIDTDLENHKINLSIKEVQAYDPPYVEEEPVAEEAAEEKAPKKRAPKKKKEVKEEDDYKQEIVSSGASIADILASKGEEIEE